MSFQRVGAGLHGVVAAWIDDEELRDGLVRQAWARAAGPSIAAHTRVDALQDGALVVVVVDPAWRAPLVEIAPKLLARLRASLGPHAPNTIRWISTA